MKWLHLASEISPARFRSQSVAMGADAKLVCTVRYDTLVQYAAYLRLYHHTCRKIRWVEVRVSFDSDYSG